MRDLEGKVAVVTGGASGIGRAMAAQFAADGMQVVIADVEAPALEATSGELGVVGVQTDVGDAASVQALADHVCDRFGTVHVLCNNAGVGGGGQIADLTLADWKWVLDVNLWGVIHGLHSFLPRILANPDGGHVVNTASMAGLFASAGMGPYNATKFAVVAISETLSKELQAAGSSVGVSVLCPGFVRTNIFDSQRNRPDALRNATKAVGDARLRNDILKGFLETAMNPAEVALQVRDAIVEDRFWITTHPEFFTAVTQRADDIVTGRNPIPSTFESQSD
ncbi:MAG: SDR family NAD(P)-dependent oxidoreductase [Actinobacteria bacterium]|nr:MAG: SDR family NAD(P)-dependent oxidoreductase [Actinomycetota bacterium]